jgi:hypothetical protein
MGRQRLGRLLSSPDDGRRCLFVCSAGQLIAVSAAPSGGRATAGVFTGIYALVSVHGPALFTVESGHYHAKRPRQGVNPSRP